MADRQIDNIDDIQFGFTEETIRVSISIISDRRFPTSTIVDYFHNRPADYVISHSLENAEIAGTPTQQGVTLQVRVIPCTN